MRTGHRLLHCLSRSSVESKHQQVTSLVGKRLISDAVVENTLCSETAAPQLRLVTLIQHIHSRCDLIETLGF